MPRFTDFQKVYKLLDYYRECYPNSIQVQDIPSREMKISLGSIYRYSKKLEELGYLIHKGYNYYVWNPRTAGLGMPELTVLAMQWNLKQEQEQEVQKANGNPRPAPVGELEAKDVKNIKVIQEKNETNDGVQELLNIIFWNVAKWWKLLSDEASELEKEEAIRRMAEYNSSPNPTEKILMTLLKLSRLSTEDQIKEALDTLEK